MRMNMFLSIVHSSLLISDVTVEDTSLMLTGAGAGTGPACVVPAGAVSLCFF